MQPLISVPVVPVVPSVYFIIWPELPIIIHPSQSAFHSILVTSHPLQWEIPIIIAYPVPSNISCLLSPYLVPHIIITCLLPRLRSLLPAHRLLPFNAA